MMDELETHMHVGEGECVYVTHTPLASPQKCAVQCKQSCNATAWKIRQAWTRSHRVTPSSDQVEDHDHCLTKDNLENHRHDSERAVPHEVLVVAQDEVMVAQMRGRKQHRSQFRSLPDTKCTKKRMEGLTVKTFTPFETLGSK